MHFILPRLSPHPASFVYVHLCVSAHACVYVCMCRPEVNLGYYSSDTVYLTFWYTVSFGPGPHSYIRLGYPASKLLGSICICLLSTGITIPFYLGFEDQTQVLMLTHQVLHSYTHCPPSLHFSFPTLVEKVHSYSWVKASSDSCLRGPLLWQMNLKSTSEGPERGEAWPQVLQQDESNNLENLWKCPF